jgi:inner membrane protein involved in colicin E2 resistance
MSVIIFYLLLVAFSDNIDFYLPHLLFAVLISAILSD